MMPGLDGIGVDAPAIGILDSDQILTEFLDEMNALDLQQNSDIDTMRLTFDMGPELKKAKSEPELTWESQVLVKPLPKKRENASWLRRKQELHALRCESEALETHVAFLQTNSATPSIDASDSLEMWESVATMARQESQSAQNENARLKNELQLYLHTSERLQTELVAGELQQRKILDSRMPFIVAVPVGSIRTCHPQFTDSSIFTLLESRVNGQFHDLGAVIRDAFEPIEGDVAEHVQICREDGKATVTAVEFKHVRLLPFGEDTMSSSVWDMIELGGSGTQTDTHVVRRSSDVVGFVAHHTIHLGSGTIVNVDVHTVIKRLAVPVGMVALAASRSEWSIQDPTTGTWRYSTDEEGWVVVHGCYLQRHASVVGATLRTSQLSTAIKLRPNDDGSTITRPTLTGTIGDIVIPSFRDILSSHHQSMENFLLDSRRNRSVQ